MPPTPSPWPCLRLETRSSPPRVILDLSISPNAKRTEVVGWHDGALRIRLSAAPVEGAANEALRRWLAKEIGLPAQRVEILRGDHGRRKQVALAVSEAEVVRWLSGLECLR